MWMIESEIKKKHLRGLEKLGELHLSKYTTQHVRATKTSGRKREPKNLSHTRKNNKQFAYTEYTLALTGIDCHTDFCRFLWMFAHFHFPPWTKGGGRYTRTDVRIMFQWFRAYTEKSESCAFIFGFSH